MKLDLVFIHSTVGGYFVGIPGPLLPLPCPLHSKLRAGSTYTQNVAKVTFPAARNGRISEGMDGFMKQA